MPGYCIGTAVGLGLWPNSPQCAPSTRRGIITKQGQTPSGGFLSSVNSQADCDQLAAAANTPGFNGFCSSRDALGRACCVINLTYYPIDPHCPVLCPGSIYGACSQNEQGISGNNFFCGYPDFERCMEAYTDCRMVTCCCPSGSQHAPCEESIVPSGFALTCANTVGNLNACTLAGTGRRCDESPCGGCCLCNRFCPTSQATCDLLGGQMVANASACASSNRKPPCRKGHWKRGIRPTQHTSGMTRQIGRGVALHSKQLGTKDTTAPTSGECRTTYGWMQRHSTRGVMHGSICNFFNRNCPTQTRTTRKLKLVRHPSRGIMRMEGKYRRACPEASEMGCSTTVNCS